MGFLPNEILSEIAARLTLADRRNFRLVNRDWAAAALPLVTRHQFCLGTAQGIKEYASHLRQSQSAMPFTRSLTLYFGQWPKCTRQEWEIHPLLLRYIPLKHLLGRGIDSEQQSEVVDQAYRCYLSFLELEDARCPTTEAETLSYILSQMPNLRSFIIKPMTFLLDCRRPNQKLTSLFRSIWMMPSFRSVSNTVIEICLRACNLGSSSFDELSIYGRVEFQRLSVPDMRALRSLTITSANQNDGLAEFLAHFPTVRELTLSFRETAPMLLDTGLVLPRLQILTLRNVCVTEQALFDSATQGAELLAINLDSSIVVQGCLSTCLDRIRERDVDRAGMVDTLPI